MDGVFFHVQVWNAVFLRSLTCSSGASGIIRSLAVGEILRAAAQEARSAVQEEFGLASLGDFER